MEKLTKNHLKWAVLVSAAVMLITWFFIPAVDVMGKIKISMVQFITSSDLHPSFFWILIIILLLLAPIYVGLAVMQDKEALKSLQPIFKYDKRILFAIPFVLIVIFFLIFATQQGFSMAIGSYLYLIAAIVVCATAFVKPIDGE